ncbi:hypothetical protein SAMN04488565_2148 [Leucobacter chromiiresistens]|uniref:Uncharacterized protein n=1 Tax=Leucobacter chromiiresistens TaxID=1079994 RepID=A0A1H0ZXH4_9MICO|nr:hypothetical protein SAMN04488565_2148 [Leucobacter chromiiresistens]
MRRLRRTASKGLGLEFVLVVGALFGEERFEEPLQILHNNQITLAERFLRAFSMNTCKTAGVAHADDRCAG